LDKKSFQQVKTLDLLNYIYKAEVVSRVYTVDKVYSLLF